LREYCTIVNFRMNERSSNGAGSSLIKLRIHLRSRILRKHDLEIDTGDFYTVHVRIDLHTHIYVAFVSVLHIVLMN